MMPSSSRAAQGSRGTPRYPPALLRDVRLLRLSLLSGEGKYERHALGVLRLLFQLADSPIPQAFGHLLGARDFYLSPVREVAIVGPEPRPKSWWRGPWRVSPARRHRGRQGRRGVPLLEGRKAVNGHAAAYVCEHFICQAPVTSPRSWQRAHSTQGSARAPTGVTWTR